MKISGKMIHPISRENYLGLLDRDRIIPKIIENHEEYEQFLEDVWKYGEAQLFIHRLLC